MSASAKLAGAHVTVWQIGVGRFGLGLVQVPVMVRALGLELWGRHRFLLTLRGLCGAVAFLLLIAAFQRITLSLAMVLFYLYPASTALLSYWVAGEPMRRVHGDTVGAAWTYPGAPDGGVPGLRGPFGLRGSHDPATCAVARAT